jgi:hypothetical protein
LLIFVCAPTIAVVASVFIANAAARGGSTAVAAAATATPAAVALPTRYPPPPLTRFRQAAADTVAVLPPRFPLRKCR